MKTHKLNLDVYAVTESDYGGMHDVTVAYFDQYCDAKSFADTSSPNWPRSVKKISINHSYKVFESVADYWANNATSKRNAVLAKLTDEEIEILGLKK